MEYIYCPVCSRALSTKADLKACPQCYYPLDTQEWIIARAEKDAQEKEELEKELEALQKELNKAKCDKEGNLLTKTKFGLIQAYNKQKSTGGWTFYNENDIVQRTLENRFNFLLVVYTLFIGAYVGAKNTDNDQITLLIIGFFLIGFLFLAIFRTKNRFNITLDIVHSLEADDVSPIIHKENESRHKHPFNKRFRKNSIMGLWVPLIMWVSIIVGLIYHILKLSGFQIILK